MLGGAHDGRVAGVEIHFQRIGEVAADHGTLIEMDVVQRVDDAGDVVEILGGGFPVVASDRIDHVHRRPGGAEIDPLAPGLHVVARVLAVERELARRLGQGVLDQGARKQQAPLVGELRAGLGHRLDPGRDGIREADLLQDVEGGVMDLLDVGRRQRQIAAAFHAGADRLLVLRQRRRPRGTPRLASAAPDGIRPGGFGGRRLGLNCAHDIYPCCSKFFQLSDYEYPLLKGWLFIYT